MMACRTTSSISATTVTMTRLPPPPAQRLAVA
jgi:hypothetical protein